MKYIYNVKQIKDTLIWFSAENFRPVMSKTFIQVPIYRPNFFDAEGYNMNNSQSTLLFLLYLSRI